MKQQNDDNYTIIEKIYLYVQDQYEAKHQYLIKKTWKNGLENLKDSNIFIEYLNNISDMVSNKNLI